MKHLNLFGCYSREKFDSTTFWYKGETMKGIITLCGSTRFFKEFDEMNLLLTLNDYAVFSLGCHTRDDTSIIEANKLKPMLDKLHREKIDISDAIVVIDKNGYVGEHTRSEIKYAKEKKKAIYFLENSTFLNLIPIDQQSSTKVKP